jgi:hypothetical protein
MTEAWVVGHFFLLSFFLNTGSSSLSLIYKYTINIDINILSLVMPFLSSQSFEHETNRIKQSNNTKQVKERLKEELVVCMFYSVL